MGFDNRHVVPSPGQKVSLLEMGVDPNNGQPDPNPIKPGTRGVVRRVSRIGQTAHVDVNWENGRTLSLIIPPDRIKILP
jgi:hypothetical protein